ncbi:major capsid protein [Actinoplanes sp. URMC 104]|uniref:major capsid protein n=1 Tax=Actinoplanes sp. URMC 104 TaxID=3423409 RepID=UPI003F1E335B
MIIDDIITPAELTGYVREVPAPVNLILNQFLPDRPMRSIKAAVTEVQRTNRAATFRSWDTPVGIGRRDSFQTRELKFPPLGQKLPVGEQEELELEMARTGGDNRSALVDAIYDDADNNVRSIYNRMELARGAALSTGRFVLKENGLELEAIFGVPSDHFVAPAGADWDDHENSTPLSDMRPWNLLYTTRNGVGAGYMIASAATIGHMQMSLEVRKAAAGAGQIAPFVTFEALQQILAVHRYPQLVQYDCTIELEAQDVRAIEEGKVVFVPADAESLGRTAWGITAEALMLTRGSNPSLAFEETPGLAGVVTLEGDPPRRWTKVSAVGMPLISAPRRLMVATVWTP